MTGWVLSSAQMHSPCSDTDSTISDPDIQRSSPTNSDEDEDEHPSLEPEFIDDEMQFRYSQATKMKMVHELLRHLSDEEAERVMKGGHWPSSNKGQRWTTAYTKLYHMARKKMNDPREQVTAKIRKQEKRKVRDAAVKWAKRFLREGHIHAYKPHKKGYKLTGKRMEALANIRSMILEGCDNGRGGKTLYRNLYHLLSVKGEAFEKEMEATGLLTLRSVWVHLQMAYPKMGKMTMRFKKVRNAAPVQVWPHAQP